MSRLPRSGKSAGQVTIRATADERELWQVAADASGAESLSDFLRTAITAWSVGAVELTLRPGPKKRRLLEIGARQVTKSGSKKR